jgi:DNA repair protein RadD
MSYFIDTAVNILGNKKLRAPQLEAYLKIQEYFDDVNNKEALVVLPTGTGKTGLISIAPFGICKGRVLIITPGLVTKQSIKKAQEVLEDNFWVNFDIIFDPKDLPSLSEFNPNISDEHLTKSNIIYSNIHKLVGDSPNALINRVPKDFFDLIIVDEAHHAPASSWRTTLSYFSEAKVLHLTGTPFRGDNQEVPGEKIHETYLSEVMRDRYVKWLRKETVDAHELFFTMPEKPGVRLSKDEVLQLKEKEWIERSVALSESCSKEVIKHSVQKLNDLKQLSPDVPHKILAVGCSISHAKDLLSWYKEEGLDAVIVHSQMSPCDIAASFNEIDNNQCNVVISVNMLMEGYDHHYLSILALFRPYRSLNAFAQVVGRILRAIPENETVAFEIDNNGLVIYHKETGLDSMWVSFQLEVDRAKHQRTKEYTISDREYVERDSSLSDVTSGQAFVNEQESYLEDIDFNEIFELKRAEISARVKLTIDKFKKVDNELDDEDLYILKTRLIEKETSKAANDIDPNLIEKRPDLARKKMREILTKKAQDEVASLLSDFQLEDKATNLAASFEKFIPHLLKDTPNDGTLVRYINIKLHKKFGSVNDRDNKTLLQSIDTIPSIVQELRKMLK